MLVIRTGYVVLAILWSLTAARPLQESTQKPSVPKQTTLHKREDIMTLPPHVNNIMANPSITPSLLPAASDVTLMPNGIPASYGSVIHNIFRQYPNVFHAPNLLHGLAGYEGTHMGLHFGPNVGVPIEHNFSPLEGHHFAPLRTVLGVRLPYVRPLSSIGVHEGPVVLRGEPHGLYHIPGVNAFVPHGEVEEEGFHQLPFHHSNHVLYGENTPSTVFLGGQHIPDTFHGNTPYTYEELLRARILAARRRYWANAMNPVYLHSPHHALWNYNGPIQAHASMEAPHYIHDRPIFLHGR